MTSDVCLSSDLDSPFRNPHSPFRPLPSLTITLTTHKNVRSYPCRSMESAIKLAERFIAGVIKPRPAARGQSGTDPSTINAQPSTTPVAA